MGLSKAWGPVVPRPAPGDGARTVAGAAFGIALAALVVFLDARFAPELALHLFAPLGATAVLVFAVPSSPLAQPFSCVMGNTISALWTLGVMHSLPPVWWPAVAVAGAIACMLVTRSLHPPGGAVALLMALSPAQTLATPWPLLLLQIALMTGVLVMAGVVYHRVTGRRYPHHADGVSPPGPRHAPRLGLSTADLEALLLRFDQANNLDAQDLAALMAAAEDQAIEQRLGGVQCGQLMTPKPVVCHMDDALRDVAKLLQQHAVKCLPVVDAHGQLLGLLERSAVFEHLWALGPDAAPQAKANTWHWFKPGLHKPRKGQAQDAITLAHSSRLVRAPELTVDAETPVGQLLETLARHQVPCVPVLHDARLVGVITRTDLVCVLLQPA